MHERRHIVTVALGIIALVCAAYLRSVFNGFIWDDPEHVVNNPLLYDFAGLWQIWTSRGATMHYYPVTFTSFWIEVRYLWGLNPNGFHAVNTLLHAANAVLLWRVLSYLKVPGALAIALIFAVHPVHVESVAWISERKNVLSGLFYFLSLMMYMRFAAARGDAWAAGVGAVRGDRVMQYLVGATVLFVLSILSKTVTCSLPAVILIIIWWKTGRLRWRDVLPTLPMFALGLATAIAAIFFEHDQIGAGVVYDYSFIERFLIAGRVVWTYAWLLLWPHPLVFFYPDWTVDASAWWQYLFPVSAIALVLTLVMLHRRIGRGPAAAVLMFGGTLVPAMGFVAVFPMTFSFVADHFQYLASIGFITLVVGTIACHLQRGPDAARAAGVGVLAAVLLLFGYLTWEQSKVYKNEETLWRHTIEHNPGSTTAHLNLGLILMNRANNPQLAPEDREALLAGAVQLYERTIELDPNDTKARNNLAQFYMRAGDLATARTYIDAALDAGRAQGREYAVGYNTLGVILLRQGQLDEAATALEAAIEHRAGPYADAHFNLALVQAQRGEIDAAIESYKTAIDIRARSRQPYPGAQYGLAMLLVEQGEYERAAPHLFTAYLVAPSMAMRYNVVWALATHDHAVLPTNAEVTVSQLAEQVLTAVSQAPAGTSAVSQAHAVLLTAVAYAHDDRTDEAVQLATEMARGLDQLGDTPEAQHIRTIVATLAAGQKVRNTASPLRDR